MLPRSAVAILGKPIQAPQGLLLGFRNPEMVALPEPFGRRPVFNFESPEYDLFPEFLNVGSVSVKLGFELPIVTAVFAALARLGANYGDATVRLLECLGRLGRGLGNSGGNSGGLVRTDLYFANGSRRHATLFARRDGQRMAALPCTLAARILCEESSTARGALPVYEFLGAAYLLKQLVAEGFELR
jgi:hypothetical protein